MKTAPSEFAFPFTIIEESHPNGAPKKSFVQTGMSLRDYLAASALQGLLAKDDYVRKDFAAVNAYEYADAMLAARGGDRD